jgi:metal-responsive CopG/Arc/MetJ family transcriptional regulator
MGSVRINISLSEHAFEELSKEVEPRKRSAFIREAIMHMLKERRDQRLAAEYKEATSEIKRINQELEGTISDELD